jgi:hypothetical protein
VGEEGVKDRPCPPDFLIDAELLKDPTIPRFGPGSTIPAHFLFPADNPVNPALSKKIGQNGS